MDYTHLLPYEIWLNIIDFLDKDKYNLYLTNTNFFSLLDYSREYFNLIDFIIETKSMEVLKYIYQSKTNGLIRNRFVKNITLNTSLLTSCQNGNILLVKFFIEKGANHRYSEDKPLGIAAANGHSDIVEYLVNGGANIKSRNNYALRFAVKNGHYNMVKFLIEQGVDITVFDYEVFYTSCEYGHYEIFVYLMKNINDIKKLNKKRLLKKAFKGGSVKIVHYIFNDILDVYRMFYHSMTRSELKNYKLLNIIGKYGNHDILEYLHNRYQLSDTNNIAQVAALYGHFRIVKFLLDKYLHELNLNQLIISACDNGSIKMVKFLIEKGIDINTIGNSCLSHAILSGNTDLLHYLTNIGCRLTSLENFFMKNLVSFYDIETINYLRNYITFDDQHYINTIMSTSMYCGIIKLVKYFVDKSSLDYESYICGIISNGHVNIIKYLLNQNKITKQNITITINNSVILTIIQYGHIDMLKYLVSLGINICINYALDRAVSYGHLNIVEYLLELGHNINEFGDLPLRSATIANNINMVKYLVSQGANIYIIKDNPIYLASIHGHVKLVKYFIDLGSDYHKKNELPLYVAIINNNLDVVKCLVEHGCKTKTTFFDPIETAMEYYNNEIVEYLQNNEIK
ncbi:putative ankyrin repeat protein [Acanthamoeba castellanii mimivirus]|uniref:Putative ankyrin repeat protein R837 n=5 Tax=Mimivirus TaxID=315393 RepID=YR837_MIMIV|nr:putative ankyrin repeat protein [Acanthamoeba polyphaga mimivirus]Q5UQI8.1 RecName: Full=Putative ankyrin repeat protein R837 [Acanthamoeba polyphaga mimivirus]AEQ61052.1 ankyrin repeat-containing protein [Acanthamoeba castellanii mamavirus]AHA44991.1 putative ankyrin repeat protein [Hirudovirus strain Sangsue]AHJ40416.2 ankyrin repeat protein [Samba virus]ALR84484.1 ankyrin repeat-containing protein [Niemeyer virus]AMZ03278.1 putative ankyrin repeat protein [Mimivirus Bombay]EJN40592.1 a